MRQNRRSEGKVLTIWISRELPWFIFERLEISWASHIHPSQKWWLFQFSESFCLQFRESGYIMSLKWTSKWKLMTIQISRELPLFVFQHVDISLASHIHPSQKLWLFEFAESFHVQFQAPDILCYWIGHSSEKLWPFEFLESFRCPFRSMSIYHGPHTYTRV